MNFKKYSLNGCFRILVGRRCTDRLTQRLEEVFVYAFSGNVHQVGWEHLIGTVNRIRNRNIGVMLGKVNIMSGDFFEGSFAGLFRFP